MPPGSTFPRKRQLLAGGLSACEVRSEVAGILILATLKRRFGDAPVRGSQPASLGYTPAPAQAGVRMFPAEGVRIASRTGPRKWRNW